MSVEVRLPQWGMGMQEGTILRWLKREGDVVQADEDLVQVEAAKTTQAVTARSAACSNGYSCRRERRLPCARHWRSWPPRTSHPQQPLRLLVTPVARKLARDLGVELEQVTGSGPGGRIDESDVHAYLARQTSDGPAAGPEEPGDRFEPLSGMRRAIACNMHASLQTMAQLTLWTELDATELVRLRERLQREFALTVTDLIVHAAARALMRHPALNVSLDGDRVRLHGGIHVGLAVALDEGLIVPVIRDANRKSLSDIAAETRALADGARSGTLTPDQVTGSTFSITNLGRWGIDGFTPVVNPPEAAILSVWWTAPLPPRSCRPLTELLDMPYFLGLSP